MRKLFAALAVLGMLAVPGMAMADHHEDSATDNSEGTLCSYCYEKGEFTENNPEASYVLLFPVRITTAAVGAPMGAMAGAGRGMNTALTSVSKATFAKIPTDSYDHPVQNAAYTLLKLPVYGSIGAVGTAIAVPTAAVYGATTGAIKGFAKGYNYVDQF